jgi:hypothetical protein
MATSAPLRWKPIRDLPASVAGNARRQTGECLPISPTLPVILVRLTLPTGR